MNDLAAAQLESCFTDIAQSRMQGLPLVNPALRVQALEFECDPVDSHVWQGLLITPWFMNLVRMGCSQGSALPEGAKATRHFGNTSFEFIGVFEPRLGAFETCSLFSPMFEFANHEAALATASEILRQLRPSAAPAKSAAPMVPSRRGFLFGRASAGSVV